MFRLTRLTLKIYWIPLVFLLVSVGCKKEKTPVACFTILTNPALAGQAVYFSSCSSNADSVVYSFGDGQSSDSTKTGHVYASPGTYTVSLTAYGAGTTKTVKKTITIGTPFPYDSLVGIYHVTGSWHQEIMGVNYPSHPLDEYDTISYKYPNMLCLGTDYYFPYYYVTMATDTSHFYSFNQYAGGDGQNLEIFYFPKPYNDSIYMISIVAYSPAENTTYYKAGIKVQ